MCTAADLLYLAMMLAKEVLSSALLSNSGSRLDQSKGGRGLVGWGGLASTLNLAAAAALSGPG